MVAQMVPCVQDRTSILGGVLRRETSSGKETHGKEEVWRMRKTTEASVVAVEGCDDASGLTDFPLGRTTRWTISGTVKGPVNKLEVTVENHAERGYLSPLGEPWRLKVFEIEKLSSTRDTRLVQENHERRQPSKRPRSPLVII